MSGEYYVAPPQSTQPTQPTQPIQPTQPTQTTTPVSNGVLYFIAVFVPPVPVFMKRRCHADFWINVALCILGWIPGVIHAWWIIYTY
ncbi:hypothetical protein EI94DRAFT_1188438 [Lactarius quietus]|nr:hypothetical protein EI94DRAFT_1188438 [Lactarius quietus]